MLSSECRRDRADCTKYDPRPEARGGTRTTSVDPTSIAIHCAVFRDLLDDLLVADQNGLTVDVVTESALASYQAEATFPRIR